MLNDNKVVYFKNQGGYDTWLNFLKKNSLKKKEDNSAWKWKTESKLNIE